MGPEEVSERSMTRSAAGSQKKKKDTMGANCSLPWTHVVATSTSSRYVVEYPESVVALQCGICVHR